MHLKELKGRIPEKAYDILNKEISMLRPAQEKTINSGLLDRESILVCTPTASGKTLIAELASIRAILSERKKAIYVVPLKALATEKFRLFKKRYSSLFKIAMSIGDFDSADSYLADYDMIICTAEKLDSLIRHKSNWIKDISLMIVDEIHLLNDPGRGPTLEMLITMLRQILPSLQIIGLSATIGNPDELASWLSAKLVQDDWRPVKLEKGIHFQGEISFID